MQAHAAQAASASEGFSREDSHVALFIVGADIAPHNPLHVIVVSLRKRRAILIFSAASFRTITPILHYSQTLMFSHAGLGFSPHAIYRN